MKKILVITGRPQFFNFFREDHTSDFQTFIISDAKEAYSTLISQRFDLAFIDETLIPQKDSSQESSNKTKIKFLKDLYPMMPIVLLAEQNEAHNIVPLARLYSLGYLCYPFTKEEVYLSIEKTLKDQIQRAEIEYLRDHFWIPESLPIVSTKNPKMSELLDKIKSVAPTRSTVLLTGETGVGKSIFAQLIHQHSTRAKKQFIHVHCGAITESLLESELFGHEKGAFTGALKRKLGKFELAHGGTIFLDEISTLTLSAQIKLLQVLQNGTFQRVGGESDVTVDIRIIAATNDDLQELANKGLFRKDLLFRLNVFPISIPPLRERAEDVQKMIEVFLKKLNLTHQKNIHSIQPEVLSALTHYQWPGNVRELENLVERAYIIEKTETLTTEGFPQEIMQLETQNAVLPLNIDLPLADARNQVIENFEKLYLKELLAKTHGKINQAAEIAGIGARQLNKLMHKYQINKSHYKDEKQLHN